MRRRVSSYIRGVFLFTLVALFSGAPPSVIASPIDTVTGPLNSYAEVDGTSCEMVNGMPHSGCYLGQQSISEISQTPTSITGQLTDIGGIPVGSGVSFPLVQADLAGTIKIKGSADGGTTANVSGNFVDVITLSGDTAADGSNDGMYTVPLDLHITGAIGPSSFTDGNVPTSFTIQAGVSALAANIDFTSAASCGFSDLWVTNSGITNGTINIQLPDSGGAINEVVHLSCTTPSHVDYTAFMLVLLQQAYADFSGTAALSIDLPTGVFATSASDAFTNFGGSAAPTVPEPGELELFGIGLLAAVYNMRHVPKRRKCCPV